MVTDTAHRSGSSGRITVAGYLSLGLALGMMVYVALGGPTRDLRVPLVLSDDGLIYLAQIKGTVEHGWWWVNPSLGAPFVFNALLFPSNSNVDQVFVWLISRFTSELGLTANLAWIVMVAVSGCTATYCLRTLGASRLAAVVCGLLFALSPYALYRNLGHFSLVTYLVPFGGALTLRLATARSGELRWAGLAPLALGCAVIGFNYVYYAFFTCFLLGLGAVAGFAASRDPRVLKIGAACIAAVALCTVLNLVPSLHAWNVSGRPIIVRDKVPAEAEVYGLKIRQLVSPVFGHTFQPFLAWTQKEAKARFPLETENMISRLGLIATVGFLALLAFVVVGGAAVPVVEQQMLQGAGRLTLGAVLLATVGGFGSLFSLLVTPDIRAWNRICPFIAFYALVAVAFGLDAVRRRNGRAGWVVAAVVLVVGLFDQVHALSGLQPGKRAVADDYRRLRGSMERLEAALPQGAMVLQLPFTVYLNDSGTAQMKPYDHFQPYLASRHLRWSYPALSNEQFEWQRRASRLPLPGLARAVVSQGFVAILVDRAGFQDGAVAPATELAAAGATQIPIESGRYLAFDLRSVTAGTGDGTQLAKVVAATPRTPGLPLCHDTPVANVEVIGDARAPFGAGPISVSAGRDLKVSGWLVLQAPLRPATALDLAIDAVPFPAFYGFDRPDVEAYFKVPDYRRSGFTAVIPGTGVSRGSHTLFLRAVASDDSCYYQTPGISLRVE